MGVSFWNRIGSKVTAVLLVGVLVVFAVALGLVYVNGRQMLEATALQTLSTSARSFSDQVAAWDDTLVRLGRTLASGPDLASGSPERMSGALKSVFQTNIDSVSTTFVFDAQGLARAMGHSDGALDKISRANRKYFQGAMAGHPVNRESIFSLSTKTPSVAFAFPVFAAGGPGGGPPQGVFTLVTKLTILSQIAQKAQVGTTGVAYLTDAQGIVLAHPDPTFVTGDKLTSFADDPLVHRALGGFHGRDHFQDADGVWWFAETEVLDNGWVAVVKQQESEVFRALTAFTGVIVVAGGLGILFLVWGLYVLIGRLIRPLSGLSEALGQMALGDFAGVTLGPAQGLGRRDELGEAARALEDLVDYVQEKLGIVDAIRQGAGDFTVKVSVVSDADAFGQSLQGMLEALNAILGDVRLASNQIASGTRQIATAGQALSTGATEQAAAVEEIGSTVTEVSQKTKVNAREAAEAGRLVQLTAQAALDGSDVMKSLVEAMTRIDQSSASIGTVVKTIDNIAFQINLLALNANIEAARAGQAGKGFSVVAEEVRRLAKSSAQSVRETSDLVGQAVAHATEGHRLALENAQELQAIVDNARQAAHLVDSIVAASADQASSLGEIEKGLDQISRVTQETTASAEETASVSEQLADQAEKLADLVANFKLVDR
jgi:methyl-accepting chemotaxis protein